ncbi:MAG: MarR family winged helix-turn-helix transcriptional regulator [Pirellulales bacterium]
MESENNHAVRDKYRRAAERCACFHFRKASRAVTQLYDEVLQPTGLRSTQLVILIAISLHEQISPARLARELVMDRSTLVRNLKPLEKRGLVSTRPGKDRRTRTIELTELGEGELTRAIPYWEKAQEHFERNLGEQHWEEMLRGLSSAVTISRERPRS